MLFDAMRHFEGDGAFVTQSRMAPHQVVEVVDVIANQFPSLPFAFEASAGLVAQKFGFECAEEAFRHRIVQALSFATHAGLSAGAFQELLKQLAAVLTAPVAVVKKGPLVVCKTACFQGTVPRSGDQSRFQTVIDSPTDNAS